MHNRTNKNKSDRINCATQNVSRLSRLGAFQSAPSHAQKTVEQWLTRLLNVAPNAVLDADEHGNIYCHKGSSDDAMKFMTQNPWPLADWKMLQLVIPEPRTMR